MSFPTDLKHFGIGEFRYPQMMNEPFLRWFDRVRDRAGIPLTLTDDGRPDGNPEPSGSAGGQSLHHRGCAVDFRTKDFTAAQKWRIAAAIHALASETPNGWKVEFESVYSATDRHWHVGLDWSVGKDHEFIEADD